MNDIIIIGAGPAGLAAYYQLKQLGCNPRILDEGTRIGSSWRLRHPQLRLNTHRWYSHLPGMKIPKRYGRWVAKDDFIQYLEDYVDTFKIEIEFGIHVKEVQQSEGSWRLHTSAGILETRHVIVSCGVNRIPKWPVIPGMESFTHKFIHASQFDKLSEYDGLKVLIIGAGNSGFDIANHLIKGKVKELYLSVRTPPGIAPKEFKGFPMQLLSAWLRWLPIRIQDYLFHSTQTNFYKDFENTYLGPAPRHFITRHSLTGITASVDDGFMNALRNGKATLVNEIIKIDHQQVTAKDGTLIQPDVIICATGYEPGLKNLIGHLDVFDDYGIPKTTGAQSHPNYPGLWFIGLRGYIWGNMYEQLIQSKQLAKAIKSFSKV